MNDLSALGLEEVKDDTKVFKKDSKKIYATVDTNWFNSLFEKWKIFNPKKKEQDFCNEIVRDALERKQHEYEIKAGDV